MGYILGRNKVQTNIIMIVAYILGYFGLWLLIGIIDENQSQDFVLYLKITYTLSLPYALLEIYMFYTLRRSLVFKIQLVIASVIALIMIILTFTGYFVTFEKYTLFYSYLHNIRLILYLVLLVIVFITKEKVLTFVYFFLLLTLKIFAGFNIVENLVNSDLNNTLTANQLFLFLNFFQFMLSGSIFIVLLIIFNKYGFKLYKNKSELELL